MAAVGKLPKKAAEEEEIRLDIHERASASSLTRPTLRHKHAVQSSVES